MHLNPFVNLNEEGHGYKKVESGAKQIASVGTRKNRLRLAHFTVPIPSNAGDLLLSHSLRILFVKVWGNQQWEVLQVRDHTEMSTIVDSLKMRGAANTDYPEITMTDLASPSAFLIATKPR